jgi:polyhydroxyalkanoate synthesis regulator phasin
MGSRVIGFRVPDDLAEELERVSSERGKTTAEFLRKLVDDALYPSGREQTPTMADASLEEQINRLEDMQLLVSEEFLNLSRQVEKLTKQIEQMQAKSVLSPEQITVLDHAANLSDSVEELGKSQNKLVGVLNENSNKVHEALVMLQDYKDSVDNNFGKLRSEISTLRTKLDPLTLLPSKMEAVQSDVTRLSDRLSTVERRIKQKPTDATKKIELTDGREHTFRVYRGTDGLVKPHRIAIDPTGDKYVDVSEPLD